MSDRPLVLYHGGGCQDGWTACWAAWLHFKDAADYQAVNYGQSPPDVTGRRVYLLDFSYKRQPMLNMATAAKSVTCLDHHRTAEQELAGLGHPNFRCVFDMTKCGARLAWEYFHPGKPAPFLIDLVEDRDLWLWKIHESKALNALLGTIERTFENWDQLANRWEEPHLEKGIPGLYEDRWVYDGHMEDMVEQGHAILRYQAGVVRSHCDKAVTRTIAGHDVPVVNTTTLQSEIVGKLAEGHPFAAGYFDNLQSGLRVWSLRSREGGVDVSQIARSLGGGGHKNAAGYQEKLPS